MDAKEEHVVIAHNAKTLTDDGLRAYKNALIIYYKKQLTILTVTVTLTHYYRSRSEEQLLGGNPEFRAARGPLGRRVPLGTEPLGG